MGSIIIIIQNPITSLVTTCGRIGKGQQVVLVFMVDSQSFASQLICLSNIFSCGAEFCISSSCSIHYTRDCLYEQEITDG